MKKYRALKKEGRIMAVIRPADPEAALAESNRIMAASKSGELTFEECQEQLNAMLQMQAYTYVGIASGELPKRGTEPALLNHDRTKIETDHIKPGDSFVPYEQPSGAGV